MLPSGLEVSLWERMLAPENLSRALRRVRANRGAPGVDGMTTDELGRWLREHWVRVPEALDEGTYRPSLVRRVVIGTIWRATDLAVRGEASLGYGRMESATRLPSSPAASCATRPTVRSVPPRPACPTAGHNVLSTR